MLVMVEYPGLCFCTGANLEHESSRGDTALTLASSEGHLDVVKTLIAAGGMTPQNCVVPVQSKLQFAHHNCMTPIDVDCSQPNTSKLEKQFKNNAQIGPVIAYFKTKTKCDCCCYHNW